jgi:hypothetical protein
VSDTGNAVAWAEVMLRHMEVDLKYAPDVLAGISPKTLALSWRGNIVRGATAAKLWRSHGRQTLAIHPEIQRETSKASSSKFPMEILRTIPYLNPMVVYSDPPIIPSWRRGSDPETLMEYQESHMRLVGFVVYGQARELVSQKGYDSELAALRDITGSTMLSHDPAATSLGLTAFFEVLDENGKRLDKESASFSLPLSGDFTLKELVEAQVNRFKFASNVGGGNRRDWVREVYKIIVGTLLYLCSTVLDAEKVPASTTRHLAKTIARKPLSFYRVGWTLGAALSKYRREQAKGPGSQQGDLMHQQDPQHRKCHFRMQWYGSRSAHACQLMRGTCDCDGRHREWIFISPYWTHKERLGDVGMNTVRRTKAG